MAEYSANIQRYPGSIPGKYTRFTNSKLYYTKKIFTKNSKPYGSIAQLAERHTCNVKVPSSILGGTLSNTKQMYYGR